MQGDRGIVALFERLGVITEFGDEGAELSATPDLYNSLDVDLTDMPDAVPALAITAAMAGIPFKLSGVGALHHKESDRIEALAASLLKLGIVTETTHYGTVFEWDGRRVPITEMPVFDTFGDHRIAMALAPVSVFVPGIVIKNAEVVDKSYPGFGMTCVMPDSFCATPTRIWRKHDCSAHFTCASFRSWSAVVASRPYDTFRCRQTVARAATATRGVLWHAHYLRTRLLAGFGVSTD